MFDAGASKWLIKEYVGNQHVQTPSGNPYYTTSVGYGANILVLDSNIKCLGKIRSTKLKVGIIILLYQLF